VPNVNITVSPQPFDNTAASTIASVQSVVNAGLDSSQAFAREMVAQASGFLDQMRAIAVQVAAVSFASVPAIGTINTTITPFTMPAAPVEPTDLAFVSPSAPAGFTGTAVTPLSVGTVPSFTAAAPTFTPPAVPTPLDMSPPAAPTLDSVSLPTSPTLTLPDVPSLLPINVPTAPLLDLPSFTAVAPTAPTAPGNVFGFNETAYTSTLLTSLRTILQTWVSGTNTGLDPTVEAALFERERQRETVITNRKIESVVRDFARSGFTRPPGAMAIEIGDALQEQQSTLVGKSREIMIAQANLEQTNRRFAMEQAWKLEEGFIQYQGMIAARALEAAKFAQQVAIDIFREVVARYGHDVEAYNAQVQAFRETLQAELAKLEVYKSEIEAQRLIGTINEQAISIYTQRVGALRTIIDLFTAEVAAANAQATVNKTQIEAFAALVSGYEARVRAKATEYQGFATLMQGEQIKSDIFKTLAEAYGQQVQGYSAGVTAQVESKKIELDIKQRVPLEVYKTGADVFRVLSEAEGTRVSARNQTYSTRANVFDVAARGEGTRVNAEVTQYKAQADVAIAQLNADVEVLKANLQKFMQQLSLLVEAAKSGGQVSAQVAGSALAGFNFSAGMHAQGSASEGYQANNSTNLSAQVSAQDSSSTITETITQYNP
jgi:hypothetical protein